MKRPASGFTFTILLGLLGVILGTLLANYLQTDLWARSVIVFLGARISSDTAGLFGGSAHTFFYEDLFRDLAIYVLGGLLTALAILLAANYIGGPVTPALPALGMHVAYVLGGSRKLEHR